MSHRNGSNGWSTGCNSFNGNSRWSRSTTESHGRHGNGVPRAFRPLFKPTYRHGSNRPQYESCFWSERNYTPLRTHNQQQHHGNDDDAEETKIGVKWVNLLADANRKAHRTAQYGLRAPIMRRGQEFKVEVYLSQGFKAKTDTIKLQLTIGDKPLQSKGTLVRLVASEKKDALKATEWGAKITKVADGGCMLEMVVMAAADCIVGEYEMYVEAHQADEDGEVQMVRYKNREHLFILFNAWCKDDAVYMANEDERQEYVMNESGRVYVGSSKKILSRPWNFGQFAKDCLKCSLHLLNISSLSKQAQSNPTQVTRCISAMANSNDGDQGVLEGNWSGKYHGGTSPSAWNGSVAIIEQYMRGNKKAVKYGQCWVFSALNTTLCRAIGIPCRSVTNFQSAHDTDHSMTIDTHVDDQGRPLPFLNDSVWNFHVWNEAWFCRPDLPSGNDGWQAFDATPQEMSEGKMQCGPCPVAAVHDGNVYLGYDTSFVFAEVNGDRVTWVVDGLSGDMTPVSCSKQAVGKFISTKAVGSNDRHDVTDQYKYKEGSDAERSAVRVASQHSSRSSQLAELYHRRTDVHFSYDGQSSPSGDICTIVTVRNDTDDQDRTIELNLFGTARYYTGIPGEEVAHNQFVFVLKPGEVKETEWRVEGQTYLSRLDEDATLGVYIMGKVKESGQMFTAEDTFSLDKPKLDVEVSTSKPKIDETFDVLVKFTNQLSVRMTECALFVEGAGIQKHKRIPLTKMSLQPGESCEKVVQMKPKYAGKKEVIVSLQSKQLVGITGYAEIDVKE